VADPPLADGGDPSSNGESTAPVEPVDPETAAQQERNAQRRERRKQRRKHGRNR
jgi:hypothetical protein